MSEKKSRPYTITGVSFGEGSQAVFSFNSDNQIVGVNERLSNGNVKPVEPGTTDFEQAITSEEALNAYNINKFKGNKESYVNLEKLERAPDEEMSNLYTRNKKVLTIEVSYQLAESQPLLNIHHQIQVINKVVHILTQRKEFLVKKRRR